MTCVYSFLTAVDGDVCLRAKPRGKELSESQGHVQIFRKGEWQNVCDHRWGPTESAVVCRQLELVAATNFSSSLKVDNDIKCNGTEDKLEQCIPPDTTKLKGCIKAVHVTCAKANPGNHVEICRYQLELTTKLVNKVIKYD